MKKNTKNKKRYKRTVALPERNVIFFKIKIDEKFAKMKCTETMCNGKLLNSKIYLQNLP